ncbi:MAG: polyprenyl synthetase family protein [Candidatus Avoscillospira sp.]
MENRFKETMNQYVSAVETYLQGCFTDESQPQRSLFEAMRYSLLAGGKRLRPVFVLEFCRLCGGDWQKALPFAAAIEMVHTYSLIHDDLPCMDNDDYRRGRLTNHKVFGEAEAVLAGDALLTAAFDTIASAEADPAVLVKEVQILASSAGEKGMVGGQVLDMEGEQKKLDEQGIFDIHIRKTGALISAACRMGCAAAKATEEQMEAARTYAEAIGLAFQIRDDMLDVIGDAKKLGKAVHVDGSKNTFVSLYGLEACAKRIEQENKKALEALSVFPDHAFLTDLTNQLASRDF